MSTAAITVIERAKVEEINREYRLSIGALGSAYEHARECGRMLSAVKVGLRHGEWLPWLADHFDGSVRAAQSYMQLADAELPNAQSSAHLSIDAALKQIQTPKPRQMSTTDVAGLLGSMGPGPGSPARDRVVREPPAQEELWTGAQERKRERVLDSIGEIREKLDTAIDPGLSAFSISAVLKAAALEARAAASKLDELAFSFER